MLSCGLLGGIWCCLDPGWANSFVGTLFLFLFSLLLLSAPVCEDEILISVTVAPVLSVVDATLPPKVWLCCLFCGCEFLWIDSDWSESLCVDEGILYVCPSLAVLLFLSVCCDKSHFLPALGILWWGVWCAMLISEFLELSFWKPGLDAQLLWCKPVLSCSGEALQPRRVSSFIWPLPGPGSAAVDWLSGCPEAAILLQIGVCIFLLPEAAKVLLFCPWVLEIEGPLMSLADVEVLFGGAPSGGLGLVWHRGEDGCGLGTGVKSCRVSSGTLCLDESLKEKSQKGYPCENTYLRLGLPLSCLTFQTNFYYFIVMKR